MEPALFARGLIVGFAIAAPVGPIGVLVIRRTLAHGRIAGLASGAGAASADAVYGALAAFGLTAVSALLVHYGVWIRAVGGIVMCYLAVQAFRAGPAQPATLRDPRSLSGAYLSTVVLTLANPATIVAFTGVFAGLGLGSTHSGGASAILVVLGVFCGSLLWWLTLSSALSLFRTRLSPGRLRWINRLSGAILLAFGLGILLSATGAI
jgi:threonine/homoserine/homoserine lactone efflux protein